MNDGNIVGEYHYGSPKNITIVSVWHAIEVTLKSTQGTKTLMVKGFEGLVGTCQQSVIFPLQ